MAIFQTGDAVRGYFNPEVTYGVPVVPAAGDAFRAVNINIEPVVNRPLINDARGTRSQMARFEGRRRATFTIDTLLRMSGTAGTAPEINDLLKHVFGTETIVASTSVTYSLLQDMSALFGTIWKKLSTGHEVAIGAAMTGFRVQWGHDAPMTVQFRGVAKDMARMAPCLANGAGSAVAALIVDDLDDLGVGAVIGIGGGTARVVTAVAHSTETATIDAVETWSDNDAVRNRG